MRTVTWLIVSALPLLATALIFTVAWYVAYGTMWPRFGRETILWPILFLAVWQALEHLGAALYLGWGDG